MIASSNQILPVYIHSRKKLPDQMNDHCLEIKQEITIIKIIIQLTCAHQRKTLLCPKGPRIQFPIAFQQTSFHEFHNPSLLTP